MLRASAAFALLASSVLAAPPAIGVKVLLTADPGIVRVDDVDTPLAKVEEAVRAGAKSFTTVALAEGAALPARVVLTVVDRCAKGGGPVRAVFPPTKSAPAFERAPLALDAWLADAPSTDEICAGTLPKDFAVTGFSPLLEIDLRGAAVLAGTGKARQLRSAPLSLQDGRVPGEPGPSAAIALAVAPDATAFDLFTTLRLFAEKGVGRVLFLLKNGPDTAGLIVSLAPESDRTAPLTIRAKPPSDKGAPAYRAMRLICEEALVALRQSQSANGTLPGDDDFTETEASALGLMAFLNVGARAGDGTKNGDCVLALERYLSGWPYDKERHPRRERTIVDAAVLDAALQTRHPLLIARTERAVAEIAKELATDSQVREGIDKGFEAIGLAAAKALDLPGTTDAQSKLRALLEATVDAEGKVLQNWSTRNTQEYLAFAYGFAAFAWAPSASPRVAGLAAQAPPEFPATDSPIPNPGRALGLFFQSRVALIARGKTWDTFDTGLKGSLPKTAPKDDLDFETKTPDQVICPWSGGHSLQSAAKVALMVMTYSAPTRLAATKK